MSDPSIQALEAEPPVRVLDRESSLPAGIATGERRVRISGFEVTDDGTLFSALASGFEFPSHFGANWDALLDSLRDLGRPPPASVRLLVDDAGAMLAQAPRTAALLIETWIIAALWWAQRGVPFQLCLLVES